MNLTPAATLFLAAAANAQVFWHVEHFDGGTNAAGWTFGAPTEVLEPGGGFWGGAYLRATGLQTAIPMVRTSIAGTPFTGNYRARSISSVSVALRVQQAANPFNQMHPSVLLISFNGTPADPSDDWGAFKPGLQTAPGLGQWGFYTFAIPSTQGSLPAGWSFVALGQNAPSNPDWNTLCLGVDRLAFSLDNPTATPASQLWEMGADYINITNQSLCYPNCDSGTIAPCLNVQDFSCFINRFAAGESWANCDNSTVPPIFNVQDFSCYLMRYALGCSAC